MAAVNTKKPLRRATYVKVKDLAPATKGHCLVVQVHAIDPATEKTRIDGSIVRIVEATVGDETGTVVLNARNEQIKLVEVGRVLVIRNASADVYNGFLRLNVTQWGKIAPHPDGIASTPHAPQSVNTSNNVSGIEYELVPAEDVDHEEGDGHHD
ncbi:hypothetical protein H310_11573 [Aphanomyces invadans]|uniref:Single-stranded DNA binding protein Ssb-like OB fold domain-containing protein n=1 Tax=Aphanomyces invadans TaxID=157072 RepID=A0A024TNP1_9STRA|nr:hypothetical protein H310_11573 [Aphanomyces invadans]ETV94927.1 hypothetical protein H310_11573 [Aphanomyces invadans]|eukprot:XP_008876518.1 hypothetical protein H310_11573 [Aphanomyces invadans]